MSSSFPGYEQFSEELGFLLASGPPPFIYIQSFEALRTTFAVVDAILHDLSRKPQFEDQPTIRSATVDAISCFTPRLFYEKVIHSLVDWTPKWENGCAIWTPEEATNIKWNENMDTFVHGLRSAHKHLGDASSGKEPIHGKGKSKAKDDSGQQNANVRLVIIVERAERLKEDHPELLVPLSRLAELTRLDLSVIFISQVGWEDVRPPLGASPDPYYIDAPSLTKEDIAKYLIARYPSSESSSSILISPYHFSLTSLYGHFITMLCDVCYPFTHDPDELRYIAAARWPGFVKPLIDDYKQRLAASDQSLENDEEGTNPMQMEPPEFLTPSEDLRIRLIRYFNTSLTSALEALLPRHTNAEDWATSNQPPDNLLSMSRTDAGYRQQRPAQAAATHTSESGMVNLPRMSKFLLVASFLASTNPAKSDLRMFGRGLDEKKRRRRAGRTATGGTAKLPQRLIGPAAFPVDRMLAILGALLEENDAESRPFAPEFSIPGEYTDMEVSRVGVYAAITELTSMGLLHRTSPVDRLDGPPMYKAAISYDGALSLAKDLDIALNDLLWDPV